MEFTIYSLGDSEFLEQVFIALALIGGLDDFGAMVQVGLLIGVFSTFISAIIKGGKGIEFQHVLVGWLIWATMFVPTARVNVEDSYTGTVRVIDNVPMGPAAAGGIISLIGFKLTEMFEVAYDPIVPRVTQTEFAESLKILNDIRHEAATGALWRSMNIDAGGGFIDLEMSWVNYIKDCTLKKIDLGLMSPSQLTTEPFNTAVDFQSQMFGTQVFAEAANPNGQNLNCADAFDEINPLTQFGGPETVLAMNSILGLTASQLPPGESAITKTDNSIQALLGGAVNSQMYMKLAVIEPILLQAASGKYNKLQDLSSAIMINQAIEQRNTQWAAEQSMFMTIVRPMIAFFEAFIYAISPIMAFVIVLGARGIALGGKYFSLLIWVQLWLPILSIVNLYIYTAARREAASYAGMAGYNWDSFYSLSSSADIMQHWIATGGLLAASTPAIALMLIYGSAVTATHLAGRLKSSDHIDEDLSNPAVKNGPLANVSAGYTGDTVSGMARSGAQDADYSLNLGSQLQSRAAAIDAEAQSHGKSFTGSLGSSLRNSETESLNFDQMASLGAMSQTMSSSERAFADKYAEAAKDAYAGTELNQRALQGLATARAAGAINLEEFLGGVAKLAKVAKGKKGADQGGDSGGGLPISARAEVSGSVADSSSVSQSQQHSKLSESVQGFDSSTSERAAFSENLASHLSSSKGRSESQSFANDETYQAAEQYTSAAQKSEAFQRQAMALNSLSTSAGASGRTIAYQVSGNQDAMNQLEGTYKSLSQNNDALRNSFNQHYDRANSLGMFGSDDQTRAWAMARALTSNGSFKSGNSDLDNSQKDTALAGVMGAIGTAMPNFSSNTSSPTSNTEVHSNQNLGGPTPDSNPFDSDGVLSEGAKSIPGGADSFRQANVSNTPSNSSDVNSFSARNQDAVGGKHNSNVADFERSSSQQIGASKAERSNSLMDSLDRDVDNGDINSQPLLSGLYGGVDNAVENLTGMAVGYTAGIDDGIGAAYSTWNQKQDELGQMSPEQIEDYNNMVSEQYSKDGAWNSFKSGASSASGWVHDVAGGDRPEGMDYRAYSHYLHTALATAAADGLDTYNEVKDDLLGQMYNNKIEEAQEAGLSGSAAQLYAQSHVNNVSEGVASFLSTVAGATPAGMAPGVSDQLQAMSKTQGQEYKDALNNFKMEFVPQNVNSDGYEYTIGSNGEQQLTMDNQGEPIRHFTPQENGVIQLTNDRYEEYTNNAAGIMVDATNHGKHSDTHAGLQRVAEIEKTRK